MKNKDFRLNTITLYSTCCHCWHLGEVGTHGAYPTCKNPESPFYGLKGKEHEKPPRTSDEIEIAAYIGGCNKLQFSGDKMTLDKYKQIPKDGHLRTLDPSTVIKDYNKDMDLSPDFDFNSEELANMYGV